MDEVPKELIEQIITICKRSDLISNSGICVLVEGQQIALFYLPKESPQAYDWKLGPIGKANNQPVVLLAILTSAGCCHPYIQHFDLQTGECPEDSTVNACIHCCYGGRSSLRDYVIDERCNSRAR